MIICIKCANNARLLVRAKNTAGILWVGNQQPQQGLKRSPNIYCILIFRDNISLTSIQDFNGLVLLNKPRGFSSAQFLNIAKRAFGAQKAGHCGTLDPLAEGLLICCLNHATKLSTYLLQGSKTYEVVMRLGAATETQDTEGAITDEAPVPDLDREDLEWICREFTGSIQQIPPVYSALKHEGVPLYKLARKGKAVAKPPRTVTVAAMELLVVELPYVTLRVQCSAGTYVRTLCHDIGLKLGCFAHMTALKRTATCGLSLTDALTLEDVRALDRKQDAPDLGFIPMREALPKMPRLWATDEIIEKISYGRLVYATDFSALQNAPIASGTTFCVMDQNGELQAIVEFTEAGQYLRQCAVFCAKN